MLEKRAFFPVFLQKSRNRKKEPQLSSYFEVFPFLPKAEMDEWQKNG